VWAELVLGGDPASTPVAVGGGLDPATLLGAYRAGMFPWPAEDAAAAGEHADRFGAAVASGWIPTLPGTVGAPLALPWWSPDPRGVLPVDRVRLRRSLRARIRGCGWTTTVDRCFAEVVDGCRRARPSSWISPQLAAAYGRLHDLGWAHSVEVWTDRGELAGGLYGVLVGRIFMAESMFHARADASKVAVVDLADRLADAGGDLVDVQLVSDHLVALGAVAVPRDEFLAALDKRRDDLVRLPAGRLPVARLTARAT
jgi:leucyl/phenylalanyl-tRNA--protein transferase